MDAGEPSPTPLVVAVGRLVPVKRFDLLIDVLVALKASHPALEAVIVGEGYKRDELEAQRYAARAEDWIHLPGRSDDDEVLDLYRRAWVLASASAREGWGMTITEAAACGTPAVATRIAGHVDAVDDGTSGIVVDRDEFVGALDRVLRDEELRTRLSRGAADHAARFTWEATALGTLEVLAADALRSPRDDTATRERAGDRRSPTRSSAPFPALALRARAIGYAVLALLAYVPAFLSDPGKVGADTKNYLYLDPDRLLARAPSLWDPNIGLGTVTHQNIGYLFPMGPSTG